MRHLHREGPAQGRRDLGALRHGHPLRAAVTATDVVLDVVVGMLGLFVALAVTGLPHLRRAAVRADALDRLTAGFVREYHPPPGRREPVYIDTGFGAPRVTRQCDWCGAPGQPKVCGYCRVERETALGASMTKLVPTIPEWTRK